MKKLLVGLLVLGSISSFASCKVGYINLEGGDTRTYEEMKDSFSNNNEFDFDFAGRTMNPVWKSDVYLVSDYKNLKRTRNKDVGQIDVTVYSKDMKRIGQIVNVGKIQTPQQKQARYQPQSGEKKSLGYQLERIRWTLGAKSKVNIRNNRFLNLKSLIRSVCENL